MSGPSSIEWTDATWNPVRGCSRVSEGCRHCYAERQAARFRDVGQVFHGFVRTHVSGEPRWTGEVALVPSALDWPLRKRKPLRIFVNSMSDLFHERLSDEDIAAVFGVMAACPQHTFQVLTKRPERALRLLDAKTDNFEELVSDAAANVTRGDHPGLVELPLPNVWLGVSVENQATADERIPLLLQCPAAVRFVSYEPAIGAVDFEQSGAIEWDAVGGVTGGGYSDFVRTTQTFQRGLIDWLIVGGESGPGARPFDLAWARSVVEQCREAGVACFVKQLGARPFWTHPHGTSDPLGDSGSLNESRCVGAGSGIGGFCYHRYQLADRKGGDWSEWPEDLRVREFPTTGASVVLVRPELDAHVLEDPSITRGSHQPHNTPDTGASATYDGVTGAVGGPVDSPDGGG